MTDIDHRHQKGRSFASAVLSRFSGLVLCAAFYSFVVLVPIPMVQRYFMGHPIAVATMVLFCLAVAQLASRHWAISVQRRQLTWTGDGEFLPDTLHGLASLEPLSNPASQDSTGLIPLGKATSFHRDSPVIDRINSWLDHLRRLPETLRCSAAVMRLSSVLDRQQRRGNASQLAEDMRDIGDRDSDADHDSLQFVRIIVWAIPMLGFLGTVVGITETLGGLDFSDGSAAVDRLKSGLYVAFDTTALGLVLSVVAIFLQFPVEKSSRIFLEEVDARVGRLLPLVLSEPDPIDRDDPLRALQQMTLEITSGMQTSIQMQAEIWRHSIDAAHHHWQSTAAEASEQLRHALQESLGTSLTQTLRDHAEGLRRVQREGAESIDNRWQQWQTALSDNARILLAHQKTLLSQGELLADSNARAKELERLQRSLDQNIHSLDSSLETSNRSLQTIAGTASMAEAMMTLAKAVDILAKRMESPRVESQDSRSDVESRIKPRRNAA